jgi:hypothetical protein
MDRKTQLILYFATVITGSLLVLYWSVSMSGPSFAPVIWFGVCYLGFALINSSSSDSSAMTLRQKILILVAAIVMNGGLLLAGYWQFHGGGPAYAFEAYILLYGLIVYLVWGRKPSKEPN